MTEASVPVTVVANDPEALKALGKEIAGDDAWLCPGELVRVVVCGGKATLVVQGVNECIVVASLTESQFQGMVASVVESLLSARREQAVTP